ncbi:MAG: M15 family metallopeptidase [Deltaproteobacteria bacterium]|nr:M15 family metallopeptidase [Deltaproteobacteria bacterium]
MVRCVAVIVMVLARVAAAGDRPGDLVEVSSVIPDAVIDLKYATADNFTGEALYAKGVCKLRRSVVARLAKAATLFRAEQRRLLVWDCYRPTSVQQLLWDKAADRRYVANPRRGSRHSRGAAVDLAVVDLDGEPVLLPTKFDEFSNAAHRVRALVGDRGIEARRLARAMKKAGFVGIPLEWWHFDAPDSARYPLSNEPL